MGGIMGKVIGISCGIFQEELKILEENNELPVEFLYLDSTLHMRPDKLKRNLDDLINETLKTYDHIILIYGDCHPYMIDTYDSDKVKKVEGINCVEIILGKERYRKLRREGAFFVFDEWANRWKEVFVKELGLTKILAPKFMNDMHKSILYLNTGVSEVPTVLLENMSDYFQLPYDILEVKLDVLSKVINDLYEECSR